MKQYPTPRSVPRSLGWPIIAFGVLLTTAILSFVPMAHAQKGDDATQILKAMSDYVASQKTISLTYDSDVEVITSEVEKIQFTSSGRVLLSRPDKVRVSRAGGYADAEVVFDGKTVTALGKNINSFSQLEAVGSIDQLITKLRGMNVVSAPGADFLETRVYDDLMADVISASILAVA